VQYLSESRVSSFGSLFNAPAPVAFAHQVLFVYLFIYCVFGLVLVPGKNQCVGVVVGITLSGPLFHHLTTANGTFSLFHCVLCAADTL